MARTILAAIFATILFLIATPSFAYVWRCHTPNGDVWLTDRTGYSDCERYEGTFSPNGVAQAPPSVQYPPPPAAPPAPPSYAPYPYPPPAASAYAPYPYPYPVPVPAPYYYPPAYYPYPRYYGGPGLYLGLPGLAFNFRFGGGHGGHGHHWR
jgi:hypothetical protein